MGKTTPPGIQLYDTYTRRKKRFKTFTPNTVRMYVCGPTVYSDPHIGNFRLFMFGDVLRRWLEYRGYDVFHVMNITDIDDKTIRDSGTEGVTLQEFTARYTTSFLRGLDLLQIKRATTYPRATEYISQMIEFIQALVSKGVAYVARDGVYFDIDQFPRYGKLSRVDLSRVKTTERMTADEYDKETINDFALWKYSTSQEIERGIYFESPWGKGRPGWHIECSVMAQALLGDTLDIHVGGEDLVFPHHENEIAQSESLTGQTFVKYWLHVRHLMVNGRKMSKSLGNYISFDDVLSKYSCAALRYFYLSIHYRRPIDFTEATMESAENSVARLRNTLDLLKEALNREDVNLAYARKEEAFLKVVHTQKRVFEAAMDDDLDTHGALDSIHALSRIINEYIASGPNKGVLLTGGVTYRELLNVLGLSEEQRAQIGDRSQALLQILVHIRDQLRKEKNYLLSDTIRQELAEVGITLSDTEKDTTWKLDAEK